METLKRSFYQRKPELVAKDLLGKLLVRSVSGGVVVGMIVETEAYLALNDLAAHAFRGKTSANSSLFLDGGHAYVHKIHAYHCLDAVCQTDGIGGSVLIRALEPISGLDIMQRNRKRKNVNDLTTGPGKICISFDIDKGLDGIDLTDENSVLRICDPKTINNFTVNVSKRVGISKSKDFDLRFTIAGNQFASR